MTYIFNHGFLSTYLHQNTVDAVKGVSALSDDEVLERTTEDLVAQAVEKASFEPVMIGDGWVDGDVKETTRRGPDGFDGTWRLMDTTTVTAMWEFTGSRDLFGYKPTTEIMSTFSADVGSDTIKISVELDGRSHDEAQFRAALEEAMTPIRQMIEYANADVVAHNASLPAEMTAAVTRRKEAVRDRRGLATALGFPLVKQPGTRPVPIKRKQVAVRRPRPRPGAPYADEPYLAEQQFNEAIDVVCSALLAMERTPSVATSMPEEHLRDQILVALNGTFGTGGATGETFLRRGKTDIILSDGERHVFVGECKWWSGSKGLADAIDQLLGYLTWRNVKATLIVFIDRADATAIIEKADAAVQAHPAFKRSGPLSPEPDRRRNFVLGHIDDPAREIQLALLFAVLPKV